MRRLKWLASSVALASVVFAAACNGGSGAGRSFTPAPFVAPSPVKVAQISPPPETATPVSTPGDVATPGATSEPEATGVPLRGDSRVEPAPEHLEITSAGMQSSLTGPQSPSQTDVRWNVIGTDLGFSFEMDGKTYIVFGDTWGTDGIEAPDWRSNTMGIIDTQNGYTITDMITNANGQAKELLSSLKKPKVEYTVMPTSGIAVGERMYLNYMSIRDWDEKWWGYKQPIVNGSGFAYSDDHGQTWVKDQKAWWQGETPFTQTALVKYAGYVYMFGTPADRFGSAKLMRVPERQLLDPQQYRYWDGKGWNPDMNAAADVVSWPVGEMSVRWSPYHQRWLMMYLNEIDHTIVLRTAERLQGPWDDPRVVVTDADYPSLYAPYMLPINGPDIYFTMSIFFPFYNVLLMHATLDNVP